MAVMAAVDLAAKPTPKTVELAPAAKREMISIGRWHWTSGSWPVAAAEEMTRSEAAAAMAEAAAVMEVAAEVAACM